MQGMNMKIIYTPGKINVLADTLSRPFCVHPEEKSCDVCFVSVEIPSFSPTDIRQKQLLDPELQKIIIALESQDLTELTRWSERGYLLSNGVLYRHIPDLDNEEAQLVIPVQCREEIMKQYHDSDVAGHYGVDRTFQKISNKFYFTGMRRYIADYIKNCIQCQRYKATNLKPSGLLQTPAPAQRFEIIAVDLFGPLPETSSQNRWILLVEDTASKWVELFALQAATAEACAKVLIGEIFLRFGTPRKIISDNGVQFISDVMQKVTFCFGIKNSFIPLYHPESNPVERKNRELKTQLSILVQDKHNTWDIHLESIRFAINSTVCESTSRTPAFLTFGREIRAPHDSVYDLRQIVNAENFVPRISPYLHKLSDSLCEAQEVLVEKQDKRKEVADRHRKNICFHVGDKVLVKTHTLSNVQKGYTNKFSTKRDGPYVITKMVTPTTYEISTMDEDPTTLGKYHVSDIYPFYVNENSTTPKPVEPKRKRGRPRKKKT
ncbi:hypothetical protein NQ317_017146 [Molorchus minor]|uniref:RNA-directed DNA polymerase n=1 Tax=Molorchus minor TaxID=1323400 RepID=A0ABQ9IQQ4_9CUCU|nr:hypothetical protein NQ317_017146 [Molorchus minor]